MKREIANRILQIDEVNKVVEENEDDTENGEFEDSKEKIITKFDDLKYVLQKTSSIT